MSTTAPLLTVTPMKEFFERYGIELPNCVIADGTAHPIECGGKSYLYYSGRDDGGTEYIMVDLVGGDPIMDSWCWHLGERGAARRAAWDEQAKSVAADPVVQREIRRYRALRAIGWTDDLCESCRRTIRLRAGGEDLEKGIAQPRTNWPEPLI